MFFKKEEKDLANRHSEDFLKIRYEATEKKLKDACKTGEIKNIKKAMKNHHKYEYALLYKTYSKHKKTC